MVPWSAFLLRMRPGDAITVIPLLEHDTPCWQIAIQVVKKEREGVPIGVRSPPTTMGVRSPCLILSSDFFLSITNANQVYRRIIFYDTYIACVMRFSFSLL